MVKTHEPDVRLDMFKHCAYPLGSVDRNI